jgi:DNA repair photolyase
MTVISASRRTDIPAFYSEWLLNRVRAGFCHWTNPFSGQVYRVGLGPEDVTAFVLWTRNPRPLLRHLPELDARGYRYTFHFTLTGYGRPLETHNPDPQAAIAAFRTLALHAGPEFVVWRYDPIVISTRTPLAYHRQRFAELAAQLEGSTRRCTYSFLDFYGKTRRNLAAVTAQHGYHFREPTVLERQDLLEDLSAIAAQHGMTLVSCCEEDYTTIPRVYRGSCVDLDLLSRLTGQPALALKPHPTREHCGCVRSVDIGSYDTCLFGCTYCYATNSRSAAQRQRAAHDPHDTILNRPERLRGQNLDALIDAERELIPVRLL